MKLSLVVSEVYFTALLNSLT